MPGTQPFGGTMLSLPTSTICSWSTTTPSSWRVSARTWSRRGYRVTRVNSGDKAVELLQRTAFDLVITDLVMERMDGIQVLKKTKEIDSTIMVIVLTGFGDMLSAIEALRSQADDYMLKPCESVRDVFPGGTLPGEARVGAPDPPLPENPSHVLRLQEDPGRHGQGARPGGVGPGGAVHPRTGPPGHHLQLLPGVRAPDPPGVHQAASVTPATGDLAPPTPIRIEKGKDLSHAEPRDNRPWSLCSLIALAPAAPGQAAAEWEVIRA